MVRANVGSGEHESVKYWGCTEQKEAKPTPDGVDEFQKNKSVNKICDGEPEQECIEVRSVDYPKLPNEKKSVNE